MPKPRLETRERPPSSYSEQKNARILASARSLFTKSGYEVTSMDKVAADAKVSKATVYAHFGSKPDLFAAVIANEAQTHVVSLTADASEALEVVLERFGRDAAELLLTPTNTAMFRMIAAESARFPDLGRIFFAAGPRRLQQDLATYLAAAMDRGELRPSDADITACHFLALICGDLQIREILGLDGAPEAEQRETILLAGIEVFLRAYRLPDD